MPQHPGFTLREHMQARGLRVSRLATLSGISQGLLDSILSGRSTISQKTAAKLGLAFQQSPTFWLKLQYDYTIAFLERQEEEQRHARWAEPPASYLFEILGEERMEALDEFVTTLGKPRRR